jgi:hypothetical protein
MRAAFPSRVVVAHVDALTPAERAAVERWTDTVFGPQPYVIAPVEWVCCSGSASALSATSG